MSILVIGKNGQLARALSATDKPTDLGMWTFWGRNELDLLATPQIVTTVLEFRPKLIINAAAYTAVDDAESDLDTAHKLNAEAPGKLAKASAQLGIPIIHVSTDYVFDGQGQRAYEETDKTGPIGAYGKTKLAGEQAVGEHASDYLIARTSWVYSPYGKNFVETMLKLSDRAELKVVDDQLGNPTSADDLAYALIEVARRYIKGPKPPSGIYHLAGTGTASWREFSEHIFQVISKFDLHTPSIVSVGSEQYPTPAKRPKNSRLNSRKFQKEFQHVMPHWTQSVEKVVARLLENSSRSKT